LKKWNKYGPLCKLSSVIEGIADNLRRLFLTAPKSSRKTFKVRISATKPSGVTIRKEPLSSKMEIRNKIQ
jgi:hypothetical protein